MTPGTLDYIKAVAPTETAVAARPFRSVPHHLTANALVNTLQSLGLQVPMRMTAAVGLGRQLRTAGHRFPLKEVDAALSRHDVPVTDRFRLKSVMASNFILGG
jgi:hypothetical protein